MKWWHWLLAISGLALVLFIAYKAATYKKGNPDSLEKARQAKADKAAVKMAAETEPLKDLPENSNPENVPVIN